MLCDICQQNDATIHIQQIANGKKKAMNLCASCAAKNPEMSGLKMGLFNLGEMFLNPPPVQSPSSDESALKLQCQRCSWTLEKLRQSGGRLGCPACYKTFAGLITPALNSIHRGAIHTGKTPTTKRADLSIKAIERQISTLVQELPQLVKLEQYERAAQVRDEIKTLQKQLPKKRNK